MNVRVVPDPAGEAAEIVASVLTRTPDAVLALPTGRTPEGMYAELVRRGVSFARARCFLLDEFYPGPPAFAAYMRRHLYDRVDIHPGRTHVPTWGYDRLIAQAGGIDLAVLGVGRNGHIAFNEPGAPWDLGTHVERLTEDTRRDLPDAPVAAITIGIATIRTARRIVLIAAGPSKAAAIRRLMEGSPSRDWPVTALRGHPDLTVVADTSATGG